MNVLFVCLGNICRSPSAEGVFRTKAPDIDTDSAGTSAWHVGEPAYGPMQQAALARGFNLSDLRARQITPVDFDRFDLIVAMDDANVTDIEDLRPRGNTTPVVLMTDFAPDQDVSQVPDPYYTRDFDGVLTLLEVCADGLVAAIHGGTIAKGAD